MKIKNLLIKKNHQNEKTKGITLIALVVTIVVLLILAAITINLVFSENGIIKKAKDAAEAQKQAEESDRQALEDLEDEISEILGENGASASEIAAAPAEWYGKTVNYKVGNNDLQTALDAENITWKIFYADSNHIYLIASDYVPNANIPKTKENTTTSLSTNGKYMAYWNTTALEDYYDSSSGVIMNSLYKTLNKSHYDYLVANNSGAYPNNENIKAVAYMLDKNAWAGYKDSAEKAEYAIRGSNSRNANGII